MSSVEVLLSVLLEPRAALAAHETVRTVLADLLTLCRQRDARHELLHGGDSATLGGAHALEVLAAFAAAACEPGGPMDVVEALVELLATLACDRSHSARARLADRAALVAVPVQCLRSLVPKKPGKKRHRVMRVALELLAQLACTDGGRRESHQAELLAVLLRLLENAQDDPALLQHAAELLTSCLEARRANIQTAAGLNAVAILLRLLDTPSECVELKRLACEALRVIGSERALVPIIAANNAIHSLALCLRLRALHRHVEASALQLLLLLCDESQVFGQVINEDLIPVLFQILARQPSVEVASAVCRVLEGVATFAMGCKLDLAAFMTVGFVCRGSVLVQAAAAHSRDVSLVSCVFRFFATIAQNTTELPHLMNSETLDGLLALFIVHGGASSSAVSDLGDLLATIVSSLSRSALDTLTLESEDQSLPALFLCLRSHSMDLRFAANVYAIVTRHWCSRNLTKSAQALSGFIGIAVEILLLHCAEGEDATRIELIEVYNFLREMLLSDDGGDVCLACGGLSLARALGHRFPKRPGATATFGQHSLESERSSTSCFPFGPSTFLRSMSKADSSTFRLHVETMAREVNGQLNRAIAVAVNESKVGTGRMAASRSANKSSSMSRSISSSSTTSLLRTGMTDDTATGVYTDEETNRESQTADLEDTIDLEGSLRLQDEPRGSQQSGDGEMVEQDDDTIGEECDDGDQEDEANNDDSDSDGETEVNDQEDTQARVLRRLDLSSVSPSVDSSGAETPADSERVGACDVDIRIFPADQNTIAVPRHLNYSTGTLQRVEFSDLHDRPHCYIDESGIRHPRHPARIAVSREGCGEERPNAQTANKSDSFLLLHEPPSHSEPCRPPDAISLAAFIEQAARRRDEFVAADPGTRARLVYENTCVYSEARSGITREDAFERLTCPTVNPYAVPEQSKAFADTPGLTFDSWFESGNLERAIQIGEFEYDLVLRRDLNTTGHTQWFYFAVSNFHAASKQDDESPRCRRYRFNIINLCKPDSLFNQGLRPVVYSVRDASEKRVGWRRAGEDIYYFPNPFSRSAKAHEVSCEPTESGNQSPSPENNNPVSDSGDAVVATPALPTGKTAQSSNYFTLTFTIEFTNSDDTYLIAHSYPFTFSDHQRHIQRILHQHRASRRRTPQVIKHSVLCTTIQGRPCDLLTISDFSVSTQELKSRRAIILTARVHPGEAQASWIMRGIIDFLVGGSDVARVLRRLFVFHVVPMLNPDGVFHGNSRCSLSACDLNRHWHDPSRELHPTIYHMKELIRNELVTRGIVFFCDIHGHSRKKNVFMYGCDTKKRPNPKARVFAKLFATQPTAKRFISFVDCSFKVSKDKENTARVVLTKELKLSWCFTLEASFGGASFGELQDVHFNTTHLRQVGSGLCETLLQACITDVSLREKIMALVDDYSVSIAACVDSHMCDAGIVSVANSVAAVPSQTPRKDKSGNSTSDGSKVVARKETSSMSKIRRRRTLGVTPEDDRKAVMATSSGAKTARRHTAKRVGTTLPRRKSTPAQANAQSEETAEPVEKKESRSRQRHISGPGTDVPAPTTAVKSRGKPLLDILGTFEPPDEEDTQLFMLQSLVRGASTCVATPETALRAFPPPEPSPSCGSTMLNNRRMTAAIAPSSRPFDEPASASSLFRFTPKDAVPIILPPPVSDLMVSRSPKPPSKHIRFKGAGRQYAALSPSPNAPRPDEFMKSNSMASAVGYEPDLINASAIPLKQRAPISITSSAGTVANELASLSFRSSKQAATSSATFPSSLLARHGLA